MFPVFIPNYESWEKIPTHVWSAHLSVSVMKGSMHTWSGCYSAYLVMSDNLSLLNFGVQGRATVWQHKRNSKIGFWIYQTPRPIYPWFPFIMHPPRGPKGRGVADRQHGGALVFSRNFSVWILILHILQVIKGSTVYFNYYRLLQVTTGCYRILKWLQVTTGYYMLL